MLLLLDKTANLLYHYIGGEYGYVPTSYNRILSVEARRITLKKIIVLLFVAVMCIGLLCGCSDEKLEDGIIGIGGIGPLSGDTSAYGTAVQNGAQLAVDEINAMGGLQFALNFKDDKNSPSTSVKSYDKLREWGMHVLLGAATTEPCLRVVDLADEHDIFTVTPSASAPGVTEGHDNVFRVTYNDNAQGKAAASYIAANALSQKIGIIYKDGDTYSEGVYTAFKTEAERLELEVVAESSFKDGKHDFKKDVAEAMDAGADLLFCPVYYEPAADIITAAAELEYSPIFFGTDGLDGLFSVEGFNKELAEGVHLLSPIPADFTNDKTRQFMEEYQSRFGILPNQFAADAYDAVYAIYEAVKHAGVTADMTAEEMCPLLSRAMTEITLDGITGSGNSLAWDANGEVQKAPVVVVIQSGMYVKK